MEISRIQQDLENSLIRLKRDVLILSIKKHTLTPNTLQVIETLDNYLPEMVERLRVIFQDSETEVHTDNVQAFHEFLMNLLQEALGVAELRQVIIDDEIEMVGMVKNEFIEIIRKVRSLI